MKNGDSNPNRQRTRAAISKPDKKSGTDDDPIVIVEPELSAQLRPFAEVGGIIFEVMRLRQPT